jgi:hypothetical protein
MKWFIFCILGMCFLPAFAADIYVEKNHQIHIDGEIRPGDAERVATLLSRMRVVGYFYVKSLGGNIEESMRIARLIEGVHARFVVKRGELCASSCFFMFIAGKERYADAFRGEDGQPPPPDKRAKGFSYVGIHRPYFASNEELKAESADKQEVLMQAVRDYLRKKQIPQYLVDEMMGRASNQIYWLREKDLDLLGVFPPGYEEVLIKKCGYNKLEQQNFWSDKRQVEFNDCIFDVWEQEYLPLQTAYIKRLATGWRPWGKP